MIERIKELFNLKDILNQELVEYIIIYLRKSRKDAEYGKDEPLEKTLERHENILQDWSKNVFGCKIPEKNIFKEVVSGDNIADRPEMQKVLELIESDNYKAVLCIEIERLARGNTIDQGTIAQKFQITNTKIITPDKIFDLDDEYDMSYFEEGLHQARRFLQYTKRILNRGRERSIAEGKYPVSTPLFGYDKIKLKQEKGYSLIKNDDSVIVRKIFDLYLYDDLGMANIAKKLNELGMNSPSNNKWTPAMVRVRIFRAEVYAGYVIWNKRKTIKKYVNGEIKTSRPINKNYTRIKGKHEPIITEEELKKVTQKINEHSVKTIPSDYELANPLGGFIKCAFCNRTMARRPYNKSGQKDSFICLTQGCKNVSSPLELVEKKILDFLKITLQNYNTTLASYSLEIKDSKDNFENEKKQLEKRIQSLNNQKQKCCDFLETGIYDEETFKIRIDSLNQDIQTINKSIINIENKIKSEKKEKYKIAIPIIKNCLEVYDKVSIQEKNKLLRSIIDVVYYKKTNNKGRWNPEAIADFELEIKLKI